MIREFNEAMQNVKVLSGLLPICAACKQVRDNAGNLACRGGVFGAKGSATVAARSDGELGPQQTCRISFKTAACHRYHVADKLGTSNAALITRYAVRVGLIEP